MRDLSLHVLDLMENSIRAGATVVSLSVRQDPAQDRLRIVIEDDGPGLSVPVEVATDPFYTTKRGKRVGLGLSLFGAAAERAGGELRLRKSRLGGLAVEATMRLGHVDRTPLGDIAATLASVAAANPHLEIRYRFSSGNRLRRKRLRPAAKGARARGPDVLAVARKLGEQVREALAYTGISW